MHKSVLITDLDNTLYDWVDIWVQSFSAMFNELVVQTGINSNILKNQIREIHQKHGTSEYAFLIEEVPCLLDFANGQDPLKVFERPIYAFRKSRKNALKLYNEVDNTLLALKQKNVKIIAYTESMAFYTNYRIRKLELDGKIDVLFSPRDHDIPKNMDLQSIRKYPSISYDLSHTRHEHTPDGKLKPSPEILRMIAEKEGFLIEDAVYVGDSLHKDIAMAKDVGMEHAWAKYGVAQNRIEYNLLREVTHWTDEDVEREKRISERCVNPANTLDRSFGQLLEIWDFGRV